MFLEGDDHQTVRRYTVIDRPRRNWHYVVGASGWAAFVAAVAAWAVAHA